MGHSEKDKIQHIMLEMNALLDSKKDATAEEESQFLKLTTLLLDYSESTDGRNLIIEQHEQIPAIPDLLTEVIDNLDTTEKMKSQALQLLEAWPSEKLLERIQDMLIAGVPTFLDPNEDEFAFNEACTSTTNDPTQLRIFDMMYGTPAFFEAIEKILSFNCATTLTTPKAPPASDATPSPQ